MTCPDCINNEQGDCHCLSPMKEILITNKFLSSVSVIRNKVVNSDDEELMKLIHTSIDMSETSVTEFIGDIEVARLGHGMELSVYFIVTDRVIGTGADTNIIKKYAFLLAVADDGPTLKCNPKTGMGKKLLEAARWAALAMSAISAIRTLANKFKVVKEFME